MTAPLTLYDFGFDPQKFEPDDKYRYYEKNNTSYVFNQQSELLFQTPYHIVEHLWSSCAFEYSVAVVSEKREGDWEARNYGLIDATGKILIPCIHSDFGEDILNEKFIAFAKNDKYGYFDLQDNTIHPYQFDRVNYDYDWMRQWRFDKIQVNGLWGAINSQYEIVLPPEWDTLEVHQFCSTYHAKGYVVVLNRDERNAYSDYQINKHHLKFITREQESCYDYIVLSKGEQQYVWRACDHSINYFTGNEPFVFSADNSIELFLDEEGNEI